MNRARLTVAMSMVAFAMAAGCASSGEMKPAASMQPSIEGGRNLAIDAKAEDLARLSDQQLAARMTGQWARLRGLTNQSLDYALSYQGTNLAQDATYRRFQADIASHEQVLTQLQDEKSRRNKVQRSAPKPHPEG